MAVGFGRVSAREHVVSTRGQADAIVRDQQSRVAAVARCVHDDPRGDAVGRRLDRVPEQIHEHLQGSIRIGDDGEVDRYVPLELARLGRQTHRDDGSVHEVRDGARLQVPTDAGDVLLAMHDRFDVLHERFEAGELGEGGRVRVVGLGRQRVQEGQNVWGSCPKNAARSACSPSVAARSRQPRTTASEAPSRSTARLALTPLRVLPTSWSTLVATSAMPAKRDKTSDSWARSSSIAALICASQ